MIKKELIEITLTANTLEHYKNLGYELPTKTRTKLTVWSIDLPPSSSVYIVRTCDDCGEEHSMKRSKYVPVCRKCNSPKMAKDRKDESLTICPDCGTKISYRAKRCKECFGKAHSGDSNSMYGKKLPEGHPIVLRNRMISNDPTLHHNYKDVSSLDGRNSNAFKIWSEQVKEAYSNTCDCCSYSRVVALKAHHLYAYEANRNIALELDNGVALCANCHEEFHKMYGYGNNTKEQYLEYKETYNG